MVRLIYLDASGVLQESTDLASISAWLKQAADRPYWLDLEHPSAAEIDLLRDPLGFHPLAIEDCGSTSHHPKLDEYKDHFFLLFHGVVNQPKRQEFQTHQIGFFIAQQFLVSHHRRPSRSCALALDGLRKYPEGLERGIDFLLYRILDQMVDNYLPLMEGFETQLARIEEEVFAHPSAEVLEQIFDLRRSLARLRRIAAQQKEILNLLVRGEVEIIGDKAVVYLRDVYDHLVRLTDLAENYRDLAAGALDIYLSTTSNRLNEVMKVLTMFATVLLPLSLIAGIYGMNFEFIPGLHSPLGFWATITAMAAIAAGMLLGFRRKGWL